MSYGKITEKQQEILDYMKSQIINRGFPPSVREICEAVHLKSTSSVHSHLETLEKNGYIEFIEKKIERDPLQNKEIERTEKLELTEEQENAFNKINQAIQEDRYEEFLLYGVTGSGKTEVYLQLIAKVLEKGKTSIMLVPEISLTPQIIDRFVSRFGKEEIDTAIIFGGTNDSWTGGPIGEVQYSNYKKEDLFSFLPALCYLFERLNETGVKNKLFVLNTELKPTLNEGVIIACEHYGITLVRPQYIDKLSGHPSKAGMINIKEEIEKII